MPRKTTLVKKMDLSDVSTPSPITNQDEEHSDEELQAIKTVAVPKTKKNVKPTQIDDEALFGEVLGDEEPTEYVDPRPTRKGIRSEKQKQATVLMREKLAEANEARRLEKEAQKEAKKLEEKKKKEELILKKAMSIRKKQIKEQAILDEISDDDTPIEEIKEIAKKVKQQTKKPIAPAIAEKMKQYEEPQTKSVPVPIQTPRPTPKYIFV